MNSALTQQLDHREQGSGELHVLKLAFILLGVVLVGLSVFLPIMMGATAEHRAVGTSFSSGYLRSLTPFVTIASMASSFVAAAVILSFEKSRPGAASVLFGALTVCVFAVEIFLSLYLSLLRPLVSGAWGLFGLYLLIGLVPFGLACTMFTLASLVGSGT